jgi:hypothetical protein
LADGGQQGLLTTTPSGNGCVGTLTGTLTMGVQL